MKPGYEEFMAAIEVAKEAQAGMVAELVKMMRAGIPEEDIYHRLAVTAHSDLKRSATAAMVALYRLAELELTPPKSCDRHECYRCQMEDL